MQLSRRSTPSTEETAEENTDETVKERGTFAENSEKGEAPK